MPARCLAQMHNTRSHRGDYPTSGLQLRLCSKAKVSRESKGLLLFPAICSVVVACFLFNHKCSHKNRHLRMRSQFGEGPALPYWCTEDDFFSVHARKQQADFIKSILATCKTVGFIQYTFHNDNNSPVHKFSWYTTLLFSFVF